MKLKSSALSWIGIVYSVFAFLVFLSEKMINFPSSIYSLIHKTELLLLPLSLLLVISLFRTVITLQKHKSPSLGAWSIYLGLSILILLFIIYTNDFIYIPSFPFLSILAPLSVVIPLMPLLAFYLEIKNTPQTDKQVNILLIIIIPMVFFFLMLLPSLISQLNSLATNSYNTSLYFIIYQLLCFLIYPILLSFPSFLMFLVIIHNSKNQKSLVYKQIFASINICIIAILLSIIYPNILKLFGLFAIISMMLFILASEKMAENVKIVPETNKVVEIEVSN